MEVKQTSMLLQLSHAVCCCQPSFATLTLESSRGVVQPELWNLLELWGVLLPQEAGVTSCRTL